MTVIIKMEEPHHALSEWVYAYADKYATEPHKVALTGKTLESWRLNIWAKALSRRFWGVEYDGTIRVVSRKWRRQVACYVASECGRYKEIQFSRPVMNTMSIHNIKGTLAHELVHWYLRSTGKPCSDVDIEFIDECIRVGAPTSMATTPRRAHLQRIMSMDEDYWKELTKPNLTYLG